MTKSFFGHEKLNVREVTTEFRMKHCGACALAADNGLVGTSKDCPLRGTFHGEDRRNFWATSKLAQMINAFLNGGLVLRTHNIITNVGHAGANGRMSNQGSYNPFVNLALGTGTNSVGATDQALFTEATGSGAGRAAGTASQVTTSVTNDTTQLVHTWNFTGSFAITEEGIFDGTTAPVQTTTTQSRINTDTTVTVTSGTGFVNNDFVQWEQEIIQVTSGGGTTTLTISRGQQGTTAASHASGTTLNDITANATKMLAHQGFSVINVANGDSLQVTHKYQS